MVLRKLGFFLILVLLGGYLILSQVTQKERTLNIGIGGVWKSLHPGLQHTLWAGLVLSNQFETLVGTDEHGMLIPLAATSWSVSQDYRRFEFKIDVSRRFSDGNFLTSSDFKRSWEEALQLEPLSANGSLQDLSYRIQGFEAFEKTKSLIGIQATQPDTLVLQMREPVRMTLEYLSGIRFAAFRHHNKSLIGTGKFIISQENESNLKFEANTYFSAPTPIAPIHVEVVTAPHTYSALSQGKIDALGYTMGHWLDKETLSDKRLSVIQGPEAIHIALMVNGTKSSLFADPKLRLALQAVLLKRAWTDPDILGARDYFSVDPQVFLPTQPGRLSAEEAKGIVMEGESYIPELIRASQKHPIVFLTSSVGNWIRAEMEKHGIVFSEKSRQPGHNEYYDTVYKKSDYDLILWTFSVVNGDPDGVYHALGKHGSILCPVTYRPSVSALLEVGRSILSPDKLNEHYQLVGREVLRQVPFVHFGFSKAVSVFRNDRVRSRSQLIRRNYGNLDTFERL